MNGLLFPGQGSQVVGMGRGLYENFLPARELLHQARDILGYDLKKLMFEGPQEVLTDTRYAQPAIYTCSAMYLEKLKNDGFDYKYVAGHSLGEYNALYAANVFSFAAGLRLVARRGEAMSRMNGKGTMAAILGLTEEELSPLLGADAVMANLNSKTQIVISGTELGVEAVRMQIEGRDNVKFKQLQVSGAFHSPQMQDVALEMAAEISKVAFQQPTCSVICNVTGKPTKNPDEVRNNLIAQITGQVRWYDTIMAMKESGVTMLYEVGHGDILKRLNKTITFRPKCVGVDI